MMSATQAQSAYPLPRLGTSMSPISKLDVLSLYRALLRESSKLPDPTIRIAFSHYIRNRFRRNIRITDEKLRDHKIKTAQTKLKHLQDANAGDRDAVTRTLRFAYGSTGPIRQHNLNTFTSDGRSHQTNKQTRPPLHSPPLHAILASQLARIKHGGRAQPNKPILLAVALERRGWLGKLPERRERNIWQRWWREEPTKVFAPVEIEVSGELVENVAPLLLEQAKEEMSPQTTAGAHPGPGPTSIAALIQRLGLPMLKSQDFGLVRRAERYASIRHIPNAPKRSSGRTKPMVRPELVQGINTPVAPPHLRPVRRRYLDLLSRLPILSFAPAKTSSLRSTTLAASLTPKDMQSASSVPTAPGKFIVKFSPLAPIRGAPRSRTTYSHMSKEDHEWILRSRELHRERGSP
ncbi:hypothetical protein BDV93DRAFT_121146 [Ceratobasidium sp. AG-I]|nr:hypothetical protein BDV93DRAFT_121146 [Ceratobasidium sp. AG-I]